MFDLKTLTVCKQITVGPGLDGVRGWRARRQDVKDRPLLVARPTVINQEGQNAC